MISKGGCIEDRIPFFPRKHNTTDYRNENLLIRRRKMYERLMDMIL